MSAAILQGVPATTLDTDLWIDLPERQYIRLLNICVKLGARVIANTVVALEDDSLVNFIYQMTSLRSFATEAKSAHKLQWNGMEIRVLPLERIIASKEKIGRPKDLAHLPLLRDVAESRRRLKIKI